MLHVDFSENYACKLSREIQAFHFGGSRKQATIHTAVLYTVNATKSYATLSDSLHHDERAVWAHLEPILKELRTNCPQITTLHIINDGPVTQYRNKTNFYLLSTLPFIYAFKNSTWNCYLERAHGKGAPDGIGGAVKREADLYVVATRYPNEPGSRYKRHIYVRDKPSKAFILYSSKKQGTLGL